MVTGAYYPEVTGAGLQCRALVRALSGRVSFAVLSVTSNLSLPQRDDMDGVPVFRVIVDPARWVSKFAAAIRITALVCRWLRHVDIVHLHGMSQKTLLIVLLAKCFGKRVVIKLTSVGHDDPHTIRHRGRLAFWSYRTADRLIGVSPRFAALSSEAGLPPQQYLEIPNGVDTERFRPGSAEERREIRRQLGLPAQMPLILFVGFFSREKHPDVLFEAWRALTQAGGPEAGLVFLGTTRSRYYEVDAGLAQRLRAEVRQLQVEDRVVFVETTAEIERYLRAAEVFALPSSREGLPNALLEAMASGLACVASRLPGVTDAVIQDGINGWLVPPEDPVALADALRAALEDPVRATAVGARARKTVAEHFALSTTAQRHFDLYLALTSRPAAPAADGSYRRNGPDAAEPHLAVEALHS